MIKHYSPAVGKNQYQLSIKSSRAYDENQHQNLKEIVENLGRISEAKLVEAGHTTDSKIYQAVGFQKIQSIKPKEFRSKSTIRPSNDHNYLKNQFSDIKSKTY